MAEIYNQLARDTARNAQIAADIVDAVTRGRTVLALTNRLEHLTALDHVLRAHKISALQLHGGMRRRERADTLAALRDGNDGKPIVLLAIDKLIGQGFDAPVLDTVFLAMPIAFKPRSSSRSGASCATLKPANCTSKPTTTSTPRWPHCRRCTANDAAPCTHATSSPSPPPTYPGPTCSPP
ncbi:helicase-related protein [Nocardia sp. NPDC004750]